MFSETDIQLAREQVSVDWAAIAWDVWEGNEYADHVPQAVRDGNLTAALAYAEQIKRGLHDGCFTIRQRINTKLTGVCMAFLPK